MDYDEDRRALEVLCAAVPPEVGASFANKPTFWLGEQVDALRLTNLKEQMAINGDTDLDERRAVEKLLRCVPKKFEQLVISIETLLDLDELTIEGITGRLKVV